MHQIGGLLRRFSDGVLGMLDLVFRADDNCDVGRTRWMVEQMCTSSSLSKLLRGIPINAASIQNELKGLQVSGAGDSNVDAVCLILYWHRDQSVILVQFAKALRDTVFHAERSEGGSRVYIERILRGEEEEKARNALGRSAWRLCTDTMGLVREA